MSPPFTDKNALHDIRLNRKQQWFTDIGNRTVLLQKIRVNVLLTYRERLVVQAQEPLDPAVKI